MSGAIYAATSGAEVQQLRMQILSNNLANMNTAGYKSDEAIFRVDIPASQNPVPSPEGSAGTTVSPAVALIPMATRTDFSSGPLQASGNPLDLAIEGEGFFSVQTADGVQYTRNGSFTLSPEGLLTTHDGQPVLGDGGEIAIDGTKVEVDGSGNVVVDGQIADRLRIVKFDNPDALVKVGDTRFALDENRGVEESIEYPGVVQGMVEGSNVNAVKIMTELIEVIRGYESYQKIIRTIDENESKLIAGVGSPQ